MSSANIAAIILSAGTSARMEAFKPLLPLGGRTLVAHVIDTFRRAGVRDISVVTGHKTEALSPVVDEAGARAVFNPDYREGMFSSVCAGVARLPTDAAAFFLLPVDIPLVRPATIRRLLAAWGSNPGQILHPVFAGRRGHPPLIPAEMASDILKSTEQGGMRALLARREAQAVKIAVADENILFDLDRPGDYEAAKTRLKSLDDPSPAECEAILAEVHPADDRIARHGRKVQQAATALCRALNRAGARIDEKRVGAAALLHDIAKGRPDHAAAGGRMIEELGFFAVGRIIAAHRELSEEEARRPKEAAVVYLADKLVSEDRFVSVDARFDAAMERFGAEPAARAAIGRRRSQTLALLQKVEELAGLTLEQILLEAGIRCEKQ